MQNKCHHKGALHISRNLLSLKVWLKDCKVCWFALLHMCHCILTENFSTILPLTLKTEAEQGEGEKDKRMMRGFSVLHMCHCILTENFSVVQIEKRSTIMIR